MNTSLITQLELALAVERGELMPADVQCRVRNSPTSEWSHWQERLSPIWTIGSECMEYRRKPKPRRVWVNYTNNGFPANVSDTKQECVDRHHPSWCVEKAVEFVEVTND